MELYGLTMEKLGFGKVSIDRNLNLDDPVFKKLAENSQLCL